MKKKYINLLIMILSLSLLLCSCSWMQGTAKWEVKEIEKDTYSFVEVVTDEETGEFKYLSSTFVNDEESAVNKLNENESGYSYEIDCYRESVSGDEESYDIEGSYECVIKGKIDSGTVVINLINEDTRLFKDFNCIEVVAEDLPLEMGMEAIQNEMLRVAQILFGIDVGEHIIYDFNEKGKSEEHEYSDYIDSIDLGLSHVPCIEFSRNVHLNESEDNTAYIIFCGKFDNVNALDRGYELNTPVKYTTAKHSLKDVIPTSIIGDVSPYPTMSGYFGYSPLLESYTIKESVEEGYYLNLLFEDYTESGTSDNLLITHSAGSGNGQEYATLHIKGWFLRDYEPAETYYDSLKCFKKFFPSYEEFDHKYIDGKEKYEYIIDVTLPNGQKAKAQLEIDIRDNSDKTKGNELDYLFDDSYSPYSLETMNKYKVESEAVYSISVEY